MSAPLKDKDCIIAIFDSFAKTVMKNECRNAVDEEKTATEKMQYLFETQVQETSIRLSIWSCRGNPTSV